MKLTREKKKNATSLSYQHLILLIYHLYFTNSDILLITNKEFKQN